MNFQMTAAATKLIASGRKTIDLTDALVADAVDEDGDEQARGRPRAAAAGSTQSTLLRRAMRVSSWLKNQA